MSEKKEITYKVWYSNVIANTSDDWYTTYELKYDLKESPVILTSSQFDDLKYALNNSYRTDIVVFYRREFDENICDAKIQELVAAGRDRKQREEEQKKKRELADEKRKNTARKNAEKREKELLEKLKQKYPIP